MNKVMKVLALSAIAVAGCGQQDAEPQAGIAGPSGTEDLATETTLRADAQALRALADDVWARILENNTYLRLSEGLPIEKFEDFSLEQFHADKAAAAQFLERLQAIDPGALNADDLITWEILDFELRDDGATDDDYWLIFDITAYQSPYQIRFAQQALAAQAIDDQAGANHYLHLVLELADMIDQLVVKVEQQAERGIYLPRPALPSTRASWQGMRAEIPAAISVADERLENLTETQRDDFRSALQGQLALRVIGGLDRLLAAISEDYEAAAPEGVGLAQYPGGLGVYQRRIRRETTLDLSVEEIHRRGHDAVSDIASRMQTLREQLGFEGSAREFLDAIRTEPRFIADTPQEVEERFEMYIDRIEPMLDEYFSYRPKAPYGVRRLPPAAEAGMTYGYYSTPTDDQPVGYYNYSASNLSERSLVWAGPLIYHELLPGHHFHMATQQENESLQPYRKNYSATAFTEGWAEYASSLGIEMGLYETPYELYGRYMLEMFLATRLVVDTGMNALGWTLQEAREYMAEHVVQSEAEIATETLRYSTSIPAQALAYRIGYEKIWALRRMAEEALGQAFDIREFHSVVLADGSKPLGVLESKVQRMIDAHQGEPAVTFVRLGPEVLPDESFEKAPEQPLAGESLIIYPENMTSFYDHPGEAGYFAFGAEYGFDSLSFVLTETHPRGGPPLHTHSVEEAHVLLAGTMEYIIGDQRFTATAPYIARVPAHAPHAFVNAGDTPLNLIGVLPTAEPDYEPVGPNPLVEEYEEH